MEDTWDFNALSAQTPSCFGAQFPLQNIYRPTQQVYTNVGTFPPRSALLFSGRIVTHTLLVSSKPFGEHFATYGLQAPSEKLEDVIRNTISQHESCFFIGDLKLGNACSQHFGHLCRVVLDDVSSVHFLDLSVTVVQYFSAQNCANLKGVIIGHSCNEASFIRCKDLKYIYARRATQTRYIGAFACLTLQAIIAQAAHLCVVQCPIVWLFDGNDAGITIGSGCLRVPPIPWEEDRTVTFQEPAGGDFEGRTSRWIQAFRDMFRLPLLGESGLGGVVLIGPAALEIEVDKDQMVVYGTPTQWEQQKKEYTLWRQKEADMFPLSLASMLPFVQVYHDTGAFSPADHGLDGMGNVAFFTPNMLEIVWPTTVSVYEEIIEHGVGYFVVRADNCEFTNEYAQKTILVGRRVSYPTLALALSAVASTNLRNIASIHFIGNLPLGTIMNLFRHDLRNDPNFVTISYNTFPVCFRADFEAMDAVFFLHCPNLRYIRPGILCTSLTVQSCENLVAVNMPAIQVLKVFNFAAIDCPNLKSLACNGQMYLEACPALSQLPRPLTLDAAISIGPGCPRLPLPKESALPLDRLRLMPEMAGRVRGPAALLNLGEFFAVTTAGADSIDFFSNRILPERPLALGDFTLCPFQRMVCYVGGLRHNDSLAFRASRGPMRTAIQSSNRRRYFLPTEMWRLIALFLGAALDPMPVPEPETPYWVQQ
jgi:hypothetical protein